MKLLRFSLIILLLVGFGMLLTAQRLEAKNTDIRLTELEEEIHTIQNKQRVVKQLIEAEYERLALLSEPENTIPISFKDIITVRIEECSVDKSETECKTVNDPFERLISFLLPDKISSQN